MNMEEPVVKIRLVGGILLCMLSLAHAESERKVYLSDISSQRNGWLFFTEDGTKVSIRPSGTEPKIKFYMEVHGTLNSAEEYEATNIAAEEKLAAIAKELGI